MVPDPFEAAILKENNAFFFLTFRNGKKRTGSGKDFPFIPSLAFLLRVIVGVGLYFISYARGGDYFSYEIHYLMCGLDIFKKRFNVLFDVQLYEKKLTIH